MTLLTRWDPFREVLPLQERMNRLFQETPWTAGPWREEFTSTASFMPPVDIYEDENHLVLKVEVPGMQEKDIEVSLENNVLTVRGERKLEKEEKEENFHRIERRYGAFTRSFTLPNTVDTDKVNAEYTNGLLHIRLAKRAEAKPRQIKVNIGPKTISGKAA